MILLSADCFVVCGFALLSLDQNLCLSTILITIPFLSSDWVPRHRVMQEMKIGGQMTGYA
jgi:hypothetical protein